MVASNFVTEQRGGETVEGFLEDDERCTGHVDVDNVIWREGCHVAFTTLLVLLHDSNWS